MEGFGVWLKFLLHFIVLLLVVVFVPTSIAQLSSSERRVLFQVQQFLEYPQVLQEWNNWTNFCFLPQSPSLVVVCSGNHVTELTIVGKKTNPSKISKPSLKNLPNPQVTLSQRFSIDSFFTVLTKLSNLKKLSLVSLGLWGPLPAKIDRFYSLEMLNISSNFISGTIPSSVATFKNLRSLVLADNMFNGSIPDLKGLGVLEEVDLSNNPLGPKFPSLNPSLVRIKFKNMSLRSQIPPNLIKFNLLQLLDVSYNQLQGPIPSYLFSLPSIQYLNLGKNQLAGVLQPSLSCHGSLSFIDISSNLLIGKLPSCLGSNSRNRTVIIMLNCLSNTTSKYQRTHSFCQKQALAVDPPAVKRRKQQSTVKLSLVLWIIGGVVTTVCLLGLLILFMFRNLDRNRAKEYKSESFVFDRNPVHASAKAVDTRQVPRPMRMLSLGLPPYNVFTLEEIEDATNNFDAANLVGGGSQAQGQFYKGWLRDGSAVLVKCLKLRQKHSIQSLNQQMEVISKLRHRHLISVVGHCIVTYQDQPNTSTTTIFIVLENVTNGSLRNHLNDWKKDILKWPQRMSIAMSIAKGIQYLHAAGITENDLKIEHILLDESLIAKISSYNISFPSKVGSESPLTGQNTPNHKNSINTNTDDIYQLGVILLELVTGRQINAQTEIHELKLEVEMSLGESPSKLRDVTDPSIRGTFAHDSLKTIAQITLNCLNEESKQRPSIEDIIWHMQYSVQVQEGWTSSGNLSAKF